MPGVPVSNIRAVNNLSQQQPSSPARVGLVMGPANQGPAGVFTFEPSISTLLSDFGGGPMPELGACALREPNAGTLAVYRTATSILGVAGAVTKTPGATAGTAVNVFGAVLIPGADFNGDVLATAIAENAELEIIPGMVAGAVKTGNKVTVTVAAATTGTQLRTLINGVASTNWNAVLPGTSTGASVCGQTLATYNEIAGRVQLQALTTGQSLVVANNGGALSRLFTYATNTVTGQVATNANAEPTTVGLDAYNDLVALAAANPGKFRATLAGSGAGLLGVKGSTALPFGSTGTMTVSGNPNDAYQVTVKIVRAGALGVAAFQVSLGGQNGQPLYGGDVYAIPSGGNIVIPGTGLTLTFANTFDLNDLFAFTTTAPQSTLSDVAAGLTALIPNPNGFSLIAVPGGVDTASIATWTAALGTILDQLEQTGKKFDRLSMEAAGPGAGISNTTWANNLITFTANVAHPRISWFAGEADIASALPTPLIGRVVKTNGLRAAWARLLSFIPGRDVGDQSYGAGLTGVTQAYQNDVASILANGRFSYLYNLTNIAGIHGEMRLFDAPTGDYVYMTYGRGIDLVEFYGYINQTTLLNTAQRRAPDGKIDPAAADAIENFLNQIFLENVVKTGNAQAVDTVVDRSDTQNRLKLTYFMQPLFYVKEIDAEAGIVLQRTVTF